MLELVKLLPVHRYSADIFFIFWSLWVGIFFPLIEALLRHDWVYVGNTVPFKSCF